MIGRAKRDASQMLNAEHIENEEISLVSFFKTSIEIAVILNVRVS